MVHVHNSPGLGGGGDGYVLVGGLKRKKVKLCPRGHVEHLLVGRASAGDARLDSCYIQIFLLLSGIRWKERNGASHDKTA